MAEEEKPADETAADSAKPKSGKKKIIMLGLLGLLLVGASIGGTIGVFMMLNGSESEEIDTRSEEAVEEEVALPNPAIYYPLKPAYVVNIEGRGRRRYLKLDITVMMREDDVIAALEMHRPSIDNTVNLIAGGQIFEDIQTPEGKEFLRLQLLQELQAVFEKEIGKKGIEQVFFTNFVVQ